MKLFGNINKPAPANKKEAKRRPASKKVKNEEAAQTASGAPASMYWAVIEQSNEFLANEFIKGYEAQKKREARMGSQEFMKVYE